mmetsp:Transcript_66264/g.205018  ORF Transcript_66264/g.205018 Transcript_66264/m.205018 type:complete len:429 (+) Transcript_66264:2-1288(+)
MKTWGLVDHRRFCEAPVPEVTNDFRQPGTFERLKATMKGTFIKYVLLFHRYPLAIWAMGAYVSVMVVIMLRMIWSITSFGFFAQPKSANLRPEQESWKQGAFSWLCISWATPWVLRWGNSYDPTSTKIKSDDLGKPGFAEYEAANAVEDFNRLWLQDVKKRGTKICNMYMVILRFCTWRKIFELAGLSFVYEILMYLAPTLCVDWTLTYMERIQMLRVTDPVAADSQNQLPVVCVLVAMYTGLPLVMCVFNTVAFLMSTKLSVRLEAALTAAVFQKAQRMPVTGGQYDLREPEEEEAPSLLGASTRRADKTDTYSLVQLINSDINEHLTGFQSTVSKTIVEIPVMVCLLLLMFWKLGKSSLVAIGIAIGMTALMMYIMRQAVIRFRWFQQQVGGRLSFFQEAMHSIRMLKSNSYKPPPPSRSSATSAD